ncbi:hypothetical protein Ahy_A02g006834 isoform C [Arachis hypogaea]|uniref:Uncharacterized protein n=1 Tax=Arachis hypogaea TaxID=3818 RepID=A0A445EAV1_ARAHY|nr:hypothetical protein Ahy_A02g006834 isoform C [Arachis hypogaea]
MGPLDMALAGKHSGFRREHSGIARKANLEKLDLDPTLKAPKDRSMTKNVVLGRLTRILNPAAYLKGKMEMSRQIQEYECLVNKLKLKAKKKAEDLTQEMTELRYQQTNLLEEECKHRSPLHVS